jgi:hypothetical protein
MLPALTARPFTSALTALIRTVPEYGKRNEVMTKAYKELGGFAVNTLMLSDIPEADAFLKRAFPYLETFNVASRCYMKTFQIIGSIIQG